MNTGVAIIKSLVYENIENIFERVKDVSRNIIENSLVLLVFQKPDNLRNLSDDTEIKDFNKKIRELSSNFARRNSCYFSPGTYLEVDGDKYYKTAILFDPGGQICLKQRQIFLDNNDKQRHIQRGQEINIYRSEIGNIGFITGADCWYPEVGRFLALEGVDIVIYTNNLKDNNCWKQISGIWSQVQQNQFFALEGSVGGYSLIHAPCEVTPYRTGLIPPQGVKVSSKEYALNPPLYIKFLNKQLSEIKGFDIYITSLNYSDLEEIRYKYPLRKELNPGLYQLSGIDKLSLKGDR
ncbi:Nitrilase/cyanide hydratase [Halothermothrix orenii H 168]|uniref:Nitrilase/cyanide hydratase n=2 Tax=Halothermothrix orenii TaxID=31909 RepID=B8CW33_HALOH|nr:Nitrilase/cyanide hydratase [Halothermothrix orenii H 168]